MKITSTRVRQIIKEEISKKLSESPGADSARMQDILNIISEMGFDLGYSTWSDSNAMAVDDAKAAYPGEFSDADVEAAVNWYHSSGRAYGIQESYANPIGSGDPAQEILQWAEEGNRVTVNGKNIWAGLGNRAGLHSYADELINDKWYKSGERFTKKVDKLPAGTEVELKRYQSTSRGKGRWVTAGTVTTTGAVPTTAQGGKQPSAKRMKEIFDQLSMIYDRDIGRKHVKSVSQYVGNDEPFSGANWEIVIGNDKMIFPDKDPSGRGDYAEWEDAHGEGFWETYMAY